LPRRSLGEGRGLRGPFGQVLFAFSIQPFFAALHAGCPISVAARFPQILVTLSFQPAGSTGILPGV
jgi:hypothetical protein